MQPRPYKARRLKIKKQKQIHFKILRGHSNNVWHYEGRGRDSVTK